MNAKQRKALQLIGGDRLVALVEEVGHKMTDELERSGVSYKSRAGGALSKLSAQQVGILQDLGVAEMIDQLDEQIDDLRANLDGARERAQKALSARPEVQLSDVVQGLLSRGDPLVKLALKSLADGGDDLLTPAASQRARWQERMADGYEAALKERELEGQQEQSDFARALAKVRREREAEAADYKHNRLLPDDMTGQKSLAFNEPSGLLGGLLDPDAMGLLSEQAAQRRDGYKSTPTDAQGNPMVFKAGRWQRMTTEERQACESRERRRDEIMREARQKAREV